MLTPGVALAVLVADQATKVLVRAHLPEGEPVVVVPGVLWLRHVHNTGGAFSILSGSRWLFVVASVLVISAIAVYWVTGGRTGRWIAVSLGLVAGGAAGNLIDRLVFGRVTDFVDLGWWPVFNVSDSAIVVGAAMLAVALLLAPGRPASDAGSDGGED